MTDLIKLKQFNNKYEYDRNTKRLYSLKGNQTKGLSMRGDGNYS